MKPVYQIRKADCFVAALASLYEVPLRSLPYINPKKTGGWLDWGGWLGAWNAYLKKYNLKVHRSRQVSRYSGRKAPMIASVRSLRSKVSSHAVIAVRGKVVHDPHPSRRGVKSYQKPFGYYVFTPVDPTKPTGVPGTSVSVRPTN